MSGAYLRSAWGNAEPLCVDGCKRWVEFPATPEMMAGVGMWDRRRLPRSFLVGPPSVLPCCSPKLSCKGRSGRHVQPGALLSHDLVPCWRQLARRPDNWGERVAAHSVQAPAIIHARLRNFQFRVGGEGKVCLALVEAPGGGESHAGFRGASAGTTQERETWELLSATPEFHTGSQETGIELATTCRARLITAQI